MRPVQKLHDERVDRTHLHQSCALIGGACTFSDLLIQEIHGSVVWR
ncbi:MAG: hypothetical protein ACRDPP_00100 [Gaiellaceae bacterium]